MPWQEIDNSLQATFKFNDFNQAFAFMSHLAMHFEKNNHHPTWTNTWNLVEIKLQTHDAGNVVTDKDRALAAIIDEVFNTYKIG